MIEHKVVHGIEKMFIYNGEQKVEIPLTWGDIDVLQGYVKELKSPNVCVVLGTGQGGSALVARESVDEDVDVYTVDENPRDYKLLDREDIKSIRGDCVEVAKNWNKPIGLLLIDTQNDLSKEQFIAWEEHLVKDAIVLFHNYSFIAPKVVEGCDSLFKENSSYKVLFTPVSSPGGDGVTSMYQVQKLGN